MKTYKCTDGFVTKNIRAANAQQAAEAYALVSCSVTVVEVDAAENEVGAEEVIEIVIA